MSISQFLNRHEIETWFPRPIFVKNNFCAKENEVLREWLLEFFAINGEFKRTDELNVNTTHERHDLALEPVFADFREALIKEVKTFATAIGYGQLSEKIYLQNMWSNISRKGEYLFPHNHPESFISGAYYVECSSTRDVIKFYDNINSMIAPAPTPNKYSFQDVKYQCLPTRLLLFRSDFLHGCPALVGDRKIVISFNYGIS